MRADPATAADTEGFAARSLLWLQLLTLAVGALQFAFVPSAVEYPLPAAGSLAPESIERIFSVIVRETSAVQQEERRD